MSRCWKMATSTSSGNAARSTAMVWGRLGRVLARLDGPRSSSADGNGGGNVKNFNGLLSIACVLMPLMAAGGEVDSVCDVGGARELRLRFLMLSMSTLRNG